MAEPTNPTREPLSKERIYRAALEIIDAEGLGALSMRRLGAALGVEAMAIYHHVPNKDALLGGVAELLLTPDAPMPAGLDWRAAVHWSAGTLRRTLRGHPAAVPLVTDPPVRTEGSARWVDASLGLLTDAGFAPDDALGLFHATLALLFGWLTLEGASLRRAASIGDASTDLAAGVPTTATLSARADDWSIGFDEALDALLDTWARRLPPGAKGAPRVVRDGATARPPGASAWIVEKGGDHKGHKKDKSGKKKGKAKKKA